MTPERQAAIDKMQFFLKQLDELIARVASGKPLAGQEKTEARERLRALKDGLKVESQALSKRQYQLDHFERCFVEPAIYRASINILSSVNSVPNQKWRSDLRSARFDLGHTISQLEDLSDDWRPGGSPPSRRRG